MASSSTWFRYSADVRPLIWVSSAATLSVLPLIVVQFHPLGPWALSGIWLASLWARTRGPYAQHNHGHLATFGSRGLNTLYDTMLTLITGYPTALWELHHNIGHHRMFLTPDADVASIYDSEGRPCGRLWYTVRGNLTIHRDALRIAKAEAARGKPRLRQKLLYELAIQALVLGFLAIVNLKLTVLFLVIPNILAAALVWWESYVHHMQVPATDIYDGSVTTIGRYFNHRNFNIGHHTAHHEKPTLHWSLLPKRTEVIAAKIPEVCWRGESPGPGAWVPHETRKPVMAERPVETAAPAVFALDGE